MSTANGNPDDDKSGLFNRVAIAFIVLSTVATIGRFWSRVITRSGRFGWDDWTCLIALILSIGLCAIGIMWSHRGLGKHVGTVSSEDLTTGLKLLYAGYYFFNIGLGVVKLSALFFYSRAFGTHNRSFNIAVNIGHGLVVAWLMFAIPSVTFQCTPIHHLWDINTPGHCLNTYAWYLADGIFDALLDIYVLILPMPMLLKLHLKPSKKWMIVGAFACGYCTLLASLGRLVSIAILGPAISEDFTWNAADVLLWSFIEPAIGIISICLPNWFYLIRRFKHGGFSSLFNSRIYVDMSKQSKSRSFRSTPSNAKSMGGFVTISGQGKHDDGVALTGMGKSHNDGSSFDDVERGLGNENIMRTTEIRVDHGVD